MKYSGQIYRVNLVYAPERGETEPTEESLSFGSKAAAMEFKARQEKKTNVLKVMYIGMGS